MPEMLVTEVLRNYANGDETTWESEFAWLYEHHSTKLNDLRIDVSKNGILSPILLGNDGRVWDGHHRLCIAVEAGMPTIPVTEVP